MAIIKCKMCGGDLEIVEGKSVVECEYCGTQQTVPNADNEKKLTLFGRANRLRQSCEFDKAAGVYESIVAEFPEEAEAYWGLVLCRYGIEYVDDPATGKKIPTCHRSSFESIMDDVNLEQALENTDAVARRVYREEAKAIEELRKGIIEVSGKEEPYDIFICYKECDENGDRTLDSVIAQDVYDALTEKGYRVFFSRITLEDKLGQEYEPYIFAALHSAKIMLAFGTDYEYYNAVWVKNEWSRFLQLITAGEKKTLIPCYKGIDAYDMPKEFARLQAQDMGKVGAIQDLVRGVEKIFPRDIIDIKETMVIRENHTGSIEPLLKRGYMALEDEEWGKADSFFEQVLNIEPENGSAYWGKFLAQKTAASLEEAVKNIIDEKRNGEKQTCTAGQPDRNREAAIAAKYVLPDYLSEKEISALFPYKFTYESITEFGQNLLSHTRKALDEDKLYRRVLQYADASIKQQLVAFEKTLFDELNQLLIDAKRADEQEVKRILLGYEAHLVSVEEKAKELYQKAEERKKNAEDLGWRRWLSY